MIITSDTNRLVEPDFQNFTTYDDNKINVTIMGPKEAFYYARWVIKGQRAVAEEYIKQDPKWAYYYTLYVIGDRWIVAEEYIKQNPEWAYWYARDVLKDRWVEAEDVIKQDPMWAYWYADVVKDRWVKRRKLLGRILSGGNVTKGM